MKKLILVSILALTAATASAGISVASQTAGVKYCETNVYDPLCQANGSINQRTNTMAVTNDMGAKLSSRYCIEHSSEGDPLCRPVMNGASGY